MLSDLITQLPNDLWPNQVINYTIIVEDMYLEVVNVVGPFPHTGSGTESHRITDGIERDANYSLRVEINSAAGSSESDRYYFSK